MVFKFHDFLIGGGPSGANATAASTGANPTDKKEVSNNEPQLFATSGGG